MMLRQITMASLALLGLTSAHAQMAHDHAGHAGASCGEPTLACATAATPSRQHSQVLSWAMRASAKVAPPSFDHAKASAAPT